MRYLILAFLLLPFLASCSTPILSLPTATGQGTIVQINITDQGILVNTSAVEVNNMSPGRTARAIYRIQNNAEGVITPDVFPELNVDTTRYKKAIEYEAAPVELAEWLIIPEQVEIPSGESVDCTVSLIIPKDAEVKADKWAFRVGVAGDCGGMTQTAVSVWWLIDMR